MKTKRREGGENREPITSSGVLPEFRIPTGSSLHKYYFRIPWRTRPAAETFRRLRRGKTCSVLTESSGGDSGAHMVQCTVLFGPGCSAPVPVGDHSSEICHAGFPGHGYFFNQAPRHQRFGSRPVRHTLLLPVRRRKRACLRRSMGTIPPSSHTGVRVRTAWSRIPLQRAYHQ